jgi:large subunit ribosomal protein L29
MKMSDLRKQSVKELAEQLTEIKREQFNLRMQKASGQVSKTHEIRRARRDAARILTALGEKN